MHSVAVPQRESMMRHERDLRAFWRRDRGAIDERILVSVTSGHTPLRRHEAIQSDFVTIRTLTTGLQNPRRIIRISSSRVRSILAVERGRERQVATDVPLCSELIIREFFGFDLLRDRRQLRELIP